MQIVWRRCYYLMKLLNLVLNNKTVQKSIRNLFLKNLPTRSLNVSVLSNETCKTI